MDKRRVVGSRRPRVSALAALILCQIAGCASLHGADLDRDAQRALEQGDASAAIEMLEEATRRSPEVSPLQNHLGLAYTSAGRDVDALAAFARALELDCSNAAARENLAAARARAAQALAGEESP